jgi:hypothetical protein
MRFKSFIIEYMINKLIGVIPNQSIDSYKKLFDTAYTMGYKEGCGYYDDVSIDEFKEIFKV